MNGFEISYWSKSNKEIDSLFKKLLFFLSQSSKHLRCSLWMSYISDITSSTFIYHFLNLRWQIKFTQVLKAIIKKLFPISFIFKWVKKKMFLIVIVASVITKPNIIACICQKKCWSYSWVIRNPCISIWKEAMLK